MCCGKETFDEVKSSQGKLSRRRVVKAMGAVGGLVALGGLTGCTQLLGIDGTSTPTKVTALGLKRSPTVALSADGMSASANPFVTATLRGLDISFRSPNGPLAIHAGFSPDSQSVFILIQGADAQLAASNRIDPELADVLRRRAIRLDVNDLMQTILHRDQQGIRRIHDQISAQVGNDFEIQIAGEIVINGDSPASTKNQGTILKGFQQLKNSSFQKVALDFFNFCGRHPDFLQQIATLMPAGASTAQGVVGLDWKPCAGCGAALGGAALGLAAMVLTDGLAGLWFGLGGWNLGLVGGVVDCSACF